MSHAVRKSRNCKEEIKTKQIISSSLNNNEYSHRKHIITLLTRAHHWRIAHFWTMWAFRAIDERVSDGCTWWPKNSIITCCIQISHCARFIYYSTAMYHVNQARWWKHVSLVVCRCFIHLHNEAKLNSFCISSSASHTTIIIMLSSLLTHPVL